MLYLQEKKGTMIKAEDSLHSLTEIGSRGTKYTCNIEVQLCGSSQGTTTNYGYKRQIHRQGEVFPQEESGNQHAESRFSTLDNVGK
jgi:hypothetical protein